MSGHVQYLLRLCQTRRENTLAKMTGPSFMSRDETRRFTFRRSRVADSEDGPTCLKTASTIHLGPFEKVGIMFDANVFTSDS